MTETPDRETEFVNSFANPENLLAVTQEDEDLCRDILEWVRDGHLAVIPGMLARHRATRPAPQITSGGGSNFYDRDGNLMRGERWIEVKGERWYQRSAPPAQPGREEVVEALDCVGLAVWCVSIADHHADTLTPKQIEKLYAASDALRAAEPLLARQDVRPEAEPVARADNFNGSTAHLLDCIDAFLDLTDDKAFVPHNLDKGSHAYRLLVAARVRLEASIQSEAKTAAALVNALADNAHPATLPTEPATVREEETFSSIIQWGDDTFGHGEPQRIIERAWEEWKEMIAPGADMAIEAADVIIVLLRLPGIAEAIQRKMTINRGREWRLLGDGTGYHVPALSTEEPKL